jgi:CHASE2 domain-containing sensor protein
MKNYWFPRKRFGWGWGLPRTWQGWVVMAVFVAAVIVICVQVPPHRDPPRFVLLVTLASAAFAFICWLTGEPPEWRWGGRADGDRPDRGSG